MNRLKVKNLFYMKELEDFFNEKDLRSKKLKFKVRFDIPEIEYAGNDMKIEEAIKRVNKKKYIKTIYSVEGKGKRKDVSNLF